MVDVAVSAVAHGYGAAPIELRLLENGRPIDRRRVKPAVDGAPVSETFHVSPNRDVPTVYTVEIPAAADELVADNNARSALVPAAGRPRRVLLVQGAPGFEHSFLRRAWAADRGLDVDSVVRKGRDDSGAETFYVQAAPSRANALVGGYPNTREALFAYDVIVLANVDPDLLTGPAARDDARLRRVSAAAACWSWGREGSSARASATRRSRTCCRSTSRTRTAASCRRRCRPAATAWP